MPDKPDNIQSVMHRLKESSNSCEEKFLDISLMKFESLDGENRLYDDFSTYYFKADPENPKDPKVTYAAQQFCKLIKVPFSFFNKNTETMRNQLVSTWMPTIKPESAQVFIKARKSSDYSTIRAILPIEYTNISNFDIVEIISEAIKDDFDMEFSIGDQRDDLILHLRFNSKETFDAFGEKCSTGFSVICSELGASDISVDTHLYTNDSKSSFIASYSGESFFTSPYEGIQADDLKSLFPQLVSHLKDQASDIKNLIQSAKELEASREETKELLKTLRLKKGLSESFHTRIYQEFEDMPGSRIDRWSFANKVSLVAKDFDVVKRSRIEKVAGELIGLSFEKS